MTRVIAVLVGAAAIAFAATTAIKNKLKHYAGQSAAFAEARDILRVGEVPVWEALTAEQLKVKLPTPAQQHPFAVSDVMEMLYREIAQGKTSDQARAVAVAKWLQEYFHHPLYTPLRPSGQGVHDPVQLLRLRRAQCGQVARVFLDIMEAGGFRGRVVQLRTHQSAEIYYEGGWHFIEADMFTDGVQFTKPDGTIPSALELHKDPDLMTGYCASCELLRVPGFLDEPTTQWVRDPNRKFQNGDHWKFVFSIKPEYYERRASVLPRRLDPEYGWMTYDHVKADGSTVRIGK